VIDVVSYVDSQRSAGRVYTQVSMNVGGVGAVVGVLIIILAAVYIWMVRHDQGD